MNRTYDMPKARARALAAAGAKVPDPKVAKLKAAE